MPQRARQNPQAHLHHKQITEGCVQNRKYLHVPSASTSAERIRKYRICITKCLNRHTSESASTEIAYKVHQPVQANQQYTTSAESASTSARQNQQVPQLQSASTSARAKISKSTSVPHKVLSQCEQIHQASASQSASTSASRSQAHACQWCFQPVQVSQQVLAHHKVLRQVLTNQQIRVCLAKCFSWRN